MKRPGLQMRGGDSRGASASAQRRTDSGAAKPRQQRPASNLPIVSSSRTVAIASAVSVVASAFNISFSLTSATMTAIFPITSARPSVDSLIAAAGGCGISLGATYCGGKVAQLLNFGLREHEEAQRAGDGTIGFVAAVVCVVLVAVSAEASSGRPTRSRLLFGSCVSAALLGIFMTLVGESLHTVALWAGLGQWGWAIGMCALALLLVLLRGGSTAKDPASDPDYVPPTPKGVIPSHYS